MTSQEWTPHGDTWTLAGRTFASRLLVGTGKYPSLDVQREAILQSGAEIVTVAVRRVDLTGKTGPTVLDALDRKRHTLLPNTAGCYSVEEAVRTARLAREVGMGDLIKLEVIGDPRRCFRTTKRRWRRRKSSWRKAFPYCPIAAMTRSFA